MSEEQKAEPLLLVFAAWTFALGVWWISDEGLGFGIVWLVMTLALLATWYVRRRPGKTPWWARSLRWSDVRSRLRRT